MTPEMLAECHRRAEASAVEQGLTPFVTDPSTLHQLAQIIYPPAPADRRPSLTEAVS